MILAIERLGKNKSNKKTPFPEIKDYLNISLNCIPILNRYVAKHRKKVISTWLECLGTLQWSFIDGHILTRINKDADKKV